MPDSTPSPPTAQVRIDALPAAYQVLVSSLQTSGFKPADLHEIFARHVLAECLQCAIQINGEDMGQLALTAQPSGAQEEDPKFSRLRQGYCARRDCTAYYYRLVFQPHPRIDWSRITPALLSLRPASEPAAPPPTPPLTLTTASRLWADTRVRVTLGLAVLLLLLVVRHFATGGSVPFMHPKPAYTVDPTSVQEER